MIRRIAAALGLGTMLGSVLVLMLLMLMACHPMPVVVVPPPAPPVIHNIACVVVNQATGRPIPQATCELDGKGGSSLGLAASTNQDGYYLFLNVPATAVSMRVTATGYETAAAPFVGDHNQDVRVPLTLVLPSVPTRAEILNVRMTFQGLTVSCAPDPDLPWFEAALPWLTPECRQAAYVAKHASTAWDGGDTHALIFLPSGPPLYNEPNQAYAAQDRFGPLDWTAGNTHIDGRLADLVVEVGRAGFPRQLLFEGGDDGEAGFPIAMAQLDLIHDALTNSAYGDLRGYVVVIPGFDGVFYGYTPQHIYDWIAKCRSLFPDCGLEHSTGHIPAGEGPGEWWAPNGPMRGLDLLLSEFDDDRFDGSVWEIAGRMLGPAYHRPPDQPAGDDPEPPWYLKDETERGPIVNCAFEFGLFGQVHGQYDADHVDAAQRPYFKSIGYTCGG